MHILHNCAQLTNGQINATENNFTFCSLRQFWDRDKKLAQVNDSANDDDVIKWEHFPCCWPFVRGIHRFPMNSPHKGQWHGALMFSLTCARMNDWVNNGKTGDLRRHRAHDDVIVTWITPSNLPHLLSDLHWTPTHVNELVTHAAPFRYQITNFYLKIFGFSSN